MQAVDRAVALAARHRAHLTLIHALGLDALGPLRDLLRRAGAEVARRALGGSGAWLQAIAADAVARGAGTTEIHVEEGLATTVVPAYADATPHDLLVVGARGEGSLRRMLVGSDRLAAAAQEPPLRADREAPRDGAVPPRAGRRRLLGELGAINELNTGKLRVATRQGVGQWTVHQWIKKAVLLSFRLKDNELVRAGDLGFYDKYFPLDGLNFQKLFVEFQ